MKGVPSDKIKNSRESRSTRILYVFLTIITKKLISPAGSKNVTENLTLKTRKMVFNKTKKNIKLKIFREIFLKNFENFPLQFSSRKT